MRRRHKLVKFAGKLGYHIVLNLTLWAIETAIFNRVRHYVLGEKRDEAWLKNARDMAVSVCDELETRQLSDINQMARQLVPLISRELRGRDVRAGDDQVASAMRIAMLEIDRQHRATSQSAETSR